MYSCFQNNPFATLLIGVYGFLYGLSRFYKNTVGRKVFLICLLKLRLLLVSGIYRNLYKEMFLPEHWEAELWQPSENLLMTSGVYVVLLLSRYMAVIGLWYFCNAGIWIHRYL